MSFMHIPVKVIAEESAEYQAFADILVSGQTGALALAAEGEKPLAALVCPSGAVEAAAGLSAIILGARPGLGEEARVLQTPARLSDVLEAIETLVNISVGLDTPRKFAGWYLDPARLVLRTPEERAIQLTDTEARLLACLFDAQGENVTRDTLLQRVWGYRPGLDTHTPETHIYRLRRKIETDPAAPSVILTTADGYRFAS